MLKFLIFAAFSCSVVLSQGQGVNKTLDVAPNYLLEKYFVTTSDGYILSLFRIPGSSDSPAKIGKTVVYLFHGLLSSAADFLTLGPQKALAYLLVDAGFDVWLGNARGNTFSRAHIYLTPKQAAFWDFEWHQIGTIDNPAMINFILNKTGKPDLHYIGHSQGTTTFFVMESMLPEMNKKIRTMHAMAPSAFLSHIISPFFRLSAPFSQGIDTLAPLVGYNEFLPSAGFLANVSRLSCPDGSPFIDVCKTVLFLIFGGLDYEQMTDAIVPKIFANTPAGASVKQFTHYLQLINSGKFRQFDYGFVQNLLTYGSLSPPDYDLSKVSTPVYLHHGSNDWVIVPKDVEILAPKLGNLTEVRLVNYTDFNHLDFIFAKDADKLLYNYIIQKIREN